MNDHDRIRFLEEQVAHLIREKQSGLIALEMAATLGTFPTCLSKLESLLPIVQETAKRVRSLLRFKAICFYLVNEADGDFEPVHCESRRFSKFFEREVEALIKENTFAWILRRNRPVLITASDKRRKLLLHVIATPFRVRGMFVGLLDQKKEEIFDVSLSLFTTIMLGSAHSLESIELYQRLGALNRELQARVAQLEESEKELTWHRERLEERVMERTRELQAANAKLEEEIAERKRMEKERVQREKLQGALEMAGAACHELNQPLQTIYGYSELLLMNISQDHPLHASIDKIRAQSERMGDITRKIMNITRYETMDYAGGRKIIDIHKASDGHPPGSP